MCSCWCEPGQPPWPKGYLAGEREFCKKDGEAFDKCECPVGSIIKELLRERVLEKRKEFEVYYYNNNKEFI